MIYERVAIEQPIRQGDIFRSVPRIDARLSELTVLELGGERATNWTQVMLSDPEVVTIAATAKPVHAIVITQNCDAANRDYIALCEIGSYLGMTELRTPPSTPGAWQRKIVSQTREQQRWFYLPPDSGVMAFADKMAVDFSIVLRVLRRDLEALKALRPGRLAREAYEHFREQMAQYFRRYPYDEWYPLDREEFEAYREKHPLATPRSWQRPPATP